MAGDWIKFESATLNKPEVMRVARKLGVDRDLVVGKLVRLWAWFDANTGDGVVDGVVDADVDALVDMDGFCDALKSVDWFQSDADNETVWLPNFEMHNGESAKKRATKNRRQSKWRDSQRKQGESGEYKNVDGPVDASASTNASTREEKRREEYTPPKSPEGEPEGFAEFWSAYPRKIGKGEARKRWKKLKPSKQLQSDILAAVQQQRQSDQWQRDGGKFIPHPATWLNQGRWEDELVEQEQSQGGMEMIEI